MSNCLGLLNHRPLTRFTNCPFDPCAICLLFLKTLFSMTKRPRTWLSTAIRRGNETITLHSTLHKWAKTRDRPVRVTDSCLGAMCNPTCPEMLTFLDTAADWGEVLNGVVLGISLVFTVACVLLKFCFVSQLALLKRSRRHYHEKHIKQVKVFMNSTFLCMYWLLSLPFIIVLQSNTHWSNEKPFGVRSIFLGGKTSGPGRYL